MTKPFIPTVIAVLFIKVHKTECDFEGEWQTIYTTHMSYLRVWSFLQFFQKNWPTYLKIFLTENPVSFTSFLHKMSERKCLARHLFCRVWDERRIDDENLPFQSRCCCVLTRNKNIWWVQHYLHIYLCFYWRHGMFYHVVVFGFTTQCRIPMSRRPCYLKMVAALSTETLVCYYITTRC
jgi:hypothetical protein